jgi:hypothetical protein
MSVDRVYYRMLYDETVSVSLKIGLHSFHEDFNPLWCTTIEHIVRFVRDYDDNLAFIRIPSSAEVCWKEEEKRFKVTRFTITKIIRLKDWELWDDLSFCLSALEIGGPDVYHNCIKHRRHCYNPDILHVMAKHDSPIVSNV